ncbi:MAG: hypothetical protein ABI759_27510 [Candidatus Solibacter sp.]
MIGSLDRLPSPADVTGVKPLVLDEPPTQKAELFLELANQFKIKPLVKRIRPQATFRKPMTESYRTLIGNRQHSSLLSDAAEFQCALHQGSLDQPKDPPPPPSDELTWGQLMAFALRQPKLASALGLVGQATITPDDPAFFASGGWVYIDLDPNSDYAGEADFLGLYAARIPKLTIARPVFAAVLFPVTGAPAAFVADDVAREAQLYDDGIAKQVHCTQGSDGGDSIQLAWEDEQIAEWLHRQVQVTPAGELEIDAPNGVSGYRVDVRLAGNNDPWNSLLRIESREDLKLKDLSLGSFQGEGIVEVAPTQLSLKQDAAYWLPSYFATWRGASLALTDADLARLHTLPGVQGAETPPHLLDREKIFVPVDDKAVPLHYGETYEFRVRLADLTRGGPEAGVPAPEPARNSIARITFQRRRQPRQVEILTAPSPASRKIRIGRPRLGYPEALFTSRASFVDLENDLLQLAAEPGITREVSVPDPDVLTLEVQVLVKALAGDALPGKGQDPSTSGYFELYRTTRSFDAEQLELELDFQNHPSLLTLKAVQPDNGSLELPTARDLRLTFVGVGRDQPGYFADEKFRRGTPVHLDLRANATKEPDLLADPDALSALRSFFFQPPPPDNSVSPPAERLATELGLDRNALTLSGRPGHRTVLGCSAELRHTLSPESSAITFSSPADLLQRWINVVQFQVQRDWSWDGMDAGGIRVTRTVHSAEGPDQVELVGVMRLPRVVGPKSVAGLPPDPRAAVRQSTQLIFFDAYDPKPKRPIPLPGEVEPPPIPFPSEITIDYVFEPAFQELPPGDPVGRSVLLPITTPPSQTPRILSAGIALSAYQAAGDYSSTSQRRRMLWFQFLGLPADPNDAYYVRVLAVGPDAALLERQLILPDTLETPLPIDPEWMRLITTGQSSDQNGLAAMQRLEDSPAGEGNYLVPLPRDLQESSPELFGFFVYEVRVGHTGSRWSTARGRFGPMLRIAGVQHPPPPLVCQAARSKTRILIRAPFARPVLDGASLQPGGPKTDLWAVLYARVQQADGQAWRNVMLARTQLFAPRGGDDPQRLGIPVLFGEAVFEADRVSTALLSLGMFEEDVPLTVLVAEVFSDPGENDPLGERVGHARMLRISPLISVPDAC